MPGSKNSSRVKSNDAPPPGMLRRFKKWYRIRTRGMENVPAGGPCVFLANRVDASDGFFLAEILDRPVRFMVTADEEMRLRAHPLTRSMRTIAAASGGKPEQCAEEALKSIKSALRQGECVCVFTECGVHNTDNGFSLKNSFELLGRELDVPFVPVYLDPVGLPLILERDGEMLMRKPELAPWIKAVLFGKAAPVNAPFPSVNRQILELGAEAAELRRQSGDLLHLRFIRLAKKRWASMCMADSTGKELTFGKTLIASIILARMLREICSRCKIVGVMLPPTVGSALSNLAILFADKIPVNLNFLAGDEAINSALGQCEIKTIITSKTFLEKIDMPVRNEMVFLEDIMEDVSVFKKLAAAFQAKLLPAGFLARCFNRSGKTAGDMVSVIFSSGTTGMPKGVMLSHHNVLSNVESFTSAVGVNDFDSIMAVLPHFHSFGFTCTIWFPLLTGMKVIYHPNPMDAKSVGELVHKYKMSVLVGTPTFFGAYVRKCPVEQFKSLRYAIVGAEKLRDSIRHAFEKKYGMELLEGYGCTEMAPVVALNVSDSLRPARLQSGNKPGTIGHPIPGVLGCIMDVETGEILPENREGVLLLKGANRMLGYLQQPERTKEAFKDGWYITGDIASIDSDGFIRITDRLSRFSKIGGEMVPHGRIEDEVTVILDGESCAVTAVHDERKGERLVVLYVREDAEPVFIWERLSASALPRLWIPKKDSIFRVPEIPVLGTGKMDLSRVRVLAAELSAAAEKECREKTAVPGGK